MTCNNVILVQPQADSSASYTIPEGDSVRLNFDPSDISGMSLGGNGSLVISFENGATLIVNNFEALANSGNLIYLADGTFIDPSTLTNALQNPDVLNALEVAAGESDTIVLEQPAENSVQEVTLTEGQKYICEFDPANAATVEIKEGQMILTFADGSQVVMSNYSEVMAGELPPELTLADGSVVNGEDLLVDVVNIENLEEEVAIDEDGGEEGAGEEVANVEPASGEEDLEEVSENATEDMAEEGEEEMGEEEMAALAEQLASVQPAAGNAGGLSNSGYGFNSKPIAVSLDSPDATGPLGVTDLAYDAPKVTGKTFAQFDDQPLIPTVIKNLDETNLGSSSLTVSGVLNVDYGNDGPGNVFVSGSTAVEGSLQNNVFSSHGVPIIITRSGNSYEGVAGNVTVFTFEIETDGTYSYQQFAPLDHADSGDDNDVISIKLGIVATDADGDNTFSSIRIDLADDAPIVLTQVAETLDETNFSGGQASTTGQFHANVGQDIIDDGYSVEGTFLSSGSQTGGTLTSQGVDVVVTSDPLNHSYQGVAGGVTVFTLQLNSATGEYTYTQFEPLDHADGSDANDIITLQFGITVTDYDGDSADGLVTIDIKDDVPVANDDGNINVSSDNSISGNVMSNDDGGMDVHVNNEGWISQVTMNGTNYAVPSGGNVVITGQYGALNIKSDGDYTYTAFGTSGNDDGVDNFSYTLRDFDGDVDTATISFTVVDDQPVLAGGGAVETVDETNLSITQTGTVDVDYGANQAGTITGNNNFSASGSLTGGQLTSGGSSVNVEFGGDYYRGVANGVTVFEITINNNGTYTYQQFESLDHADGNNANDVITLQFGIDVTDSDGDKVNGSITVNVRDDAVDAVNDVASIARNGNSASGNVLTNDDAGIDGSGLVTTPGSYTGNFGTLTLNADGSYTYVRSGRAGGTDTFNYSMRDSDGDVDSAVLSIQVTANPVQSGDGGDGGSSSPLVFDLDGDGIEMTTTENGVLFDIGADGDLDQVAWVKADDGLLVLDLNNDGEINDHSELFGSLEVDGFHMLAEYDDNNDGVINAEDEIYEDLQIWQDLNQDGISQEGELTSLKEQDIVSINLAAQMTDYDNEGSWVAYESTFTRGDGSEGQISDVWFKYIDKAHWDHLIEQMGEDAATEWLQNAHSTVNQFIPSETNDDWQVGDPLVLGSTHKVFEVGLNDSIISQDGELTVFYNGDQAGDVKGNGDFQAAGSLLGNELTSHGNEVSVVYDTDTAVYYGSTSENLVFNLQVNDDGSYTFNLFETIDHGNNVNLDDNILLQFGVTVTDADGDSTDSAIRIQVRDAGSYLSGDVDGEGDIDVFSAQDASLFQAISEATDVMADLNSIESDVLDIDLMLETTDDLGHSIQDFIYSQDTGETPILSDNPNVEVQDIAIVESVGELDLPDIISDII